jgi:hypothetical protein
MEYDIPLSEDIYLAPQIISTTGRNVVITIRSANPQEIQTISLDGVGSIFTISNNITLKLKDIKLVGRVLNTNPVVLVSLGGTLIIENGAEITGNTNNGPVSSDETIDFAGGISVRGSAIMNGGSISGNKSMTEGGGVAVYNGGIFTLNGGSIADNEALYEGGGITVYKGSFIMHGGLISGNKQTITDSSSGRWIIGGGGVYFSSGTFTKTPSPGSSTSGIIYGAVAAESLNNTAVGRKNGGGDAVLAYGIGKHRDTTLGQFDEISTLYVNIGWE